MITHQTLYTLANSLGILAMFVVVGYHILAVNARYLEENASRISSKGGSAMWVSVVCLSNHVSLRLKNFIICSYIITM